MTIYRLEELEIRDVVIEEQQENIQKREKIIAIQEKELTSKEEEIKKMWA